MRRVMKTWNTAGRAGGWGSIRTGRPRRPTGRRERNQEDEGGRNDSDSMDDAAEREEEER